MNITAEDLIDLVKESSKSIIVCTPDNDDYGRPGDWGKKRFEYVCPQLLITNLQKFIEDIQK
jgi:hypothetical protein